MVSCLLCNGDCCSSNSSTRSSSSSSSSQISNQLRVVFLLRNVFEIPREKVEVFLRTNHGDHPSEWIDLCATCEDTVKKGHRIYREFLKISSMLRTVKKDIVGVTRRGIQGQGQGQSADGGRDSISREIKQFVDKYNYGEFNNILNVSPVDIHPERPEPLAKILGEPEVKVEPELEDNHVTVQNEGQAEEAEFQDFQDSLDDPLDLDHEEDGFQVKARRSPEFVDDAEDSSEDDDRGAFSAGADTGNDQSDLESGRSRKSRKFRKRQFKGRRSSSKTGGAGRPAFLRRAKEYKMKSNARKLVRDAKTLYLPCPFCHDTAKEYSEEGEINLCDHLENCTNLQTSSTGELKCQNCGNFRCSFDAKARFVEHIGNCEGRRHDHHVIPLEKRIFVCNVCPKKVYMMLDEFNRHIVHHQKNTFQCTKCQMLFETSLFAEEHWELEHQDDDDDDGDPKWTQEPVILPAADWWCPLCNQGPFPTDDVRDEHMKTGHSEEEFKGVEKSRNRGCSFCPKQFASILELQLHRNMFHFREHHAFKCDHADCRNENEFKTEAELKEHRLSSHQLNFLYSCHICAEQLSSKVLWLGHLEAHQKAKDSKTCEICNKPFRTALMLKRHIRVDHKKLERVPCDYCDKTFKNEFHLRSHLGCHGLGEISCTQEGCTQKLSTQNKLKLHLAKVHKIGEFKCSICDQGFFTRNLLERHGRVHATDRPFNCKICGRGFKDSWNCEKHEKLHEINPNLKKRREFDMTTLDGTKRNVIKKLNSNRVICDLCGKSVPDLARHKNFFHRPKAPKVKRKYIPKVAKVCPECGKMVVDMYQHRQWCLDNPRVPKKIDPCICELCGKNFVRRENLRLHVRTVHEKKMVVECEVCKKTFKSKVYLQDHMVQVHGVKKEEFRCCDCDKVFESRLQLYSHRRKHHWKSGTLPLQCNLCGNTYPCARSLSRHIQTHENRMEKPYECDACHKKFALRGYLNQHKQKHCPHRNKTSTN